MDKNTIKLFGSKKTDNWQTPFKILYELTKEFGYMFDPCPLNAKFDGLKIPWGKVNFVNPPYSKVKEFLKKAHEEFKREEVKTIIFLVFANTDTNWFHNYVYNKAEIRFIKGRLKFLDELGQTQNSAMRPSMLVIFKKSGLNV